MNDTDFVLPTGHQGKFKKYLIAYFLGQMKCLLIDQVDTGRCFDSEVVYNGVCETKQHDMISPSLEFIKNKNEAWFLNKEVHVYNSRKKERERRERRDRRLISEKTKREKGCKNKVTFSQFSKQPTLSREFIRQKNEAWFKNKDQHIENSRKHFRDKRDHRRATVQWNDAPAPSFLSRVGRLFGFGSHWTGEYHVGDHVRTGHYRMTKNGPVWVRSHGVRGHNKKR
jgi:hypothetical protein